MFHTRSFKTFAVFFMVTVMVAGISCFFSNTITSAEAAAPSCGVFTINAAGLSASEVYYAQRFMAHEPCTAQPVPPLSETELDCANQSLYAEWASHNLSASEVYYAQKAQRFMPCETPNGLAGLPQ